MKMRFPMPLPIIAALGFLIPTCAIARAPDCTGIARWPTQVALAQLKNLGITTPERVDLAKTRTVRIASEEIGRDLFRQVHRITFTETAGTTIEVITVNDVSSQECSMSEVDVYVIAKRPRP